MAPIIELHQVTKHYYLYHHLTGGLREFLLRLPRHLLGLQRRFIALQNIELTIHKGESVGVIGRNGSGKSTLLGLVAGVLKPSQGQVIVRASVTPMLELGCGFHPDLSGKENAVLNAVLLGQSYARARQKVDAIIDFAELGEYAEEPVRTYSAGMLARLGFSIIAHTEPEILLIDEVLAVGDQRFREKCYQRIEDFRRQGTTILFVTHFAEELRKICARAIWIDQHKIVMDGPLEHVLQAYTP